MPAYDPTTETKECSACHKVFETLAVVNASFFKVKAMKDGYAARCKRCYYVKTPEAVVNERTDKAMERKYQKFIKAEPLKERAHKPFSHTQAEIRKLEQSTGLKFKGWEDMGDHMMPRLGKAE